jgi:hypothetical protein
MIQQSEIQVKRGKLMKPVKKAEGAPGYRSSRTSQSIWQ